MSQKYIAVIVLLILLVLFLAFNSEQTVVNFIVFEVQTSRALLIIFSALIGLLIGIALSYTQRKKPQQKK